MQEILTGKRPRRVAAPDETLEAVLGHVNDEVRRTNGTAKDTLSDDQPLTADRTAMIKAQEALVRPVLALFDINYDALIAMDGKSAYSQAVRARPDLLQALLESDQPVLVALAVAVGYQPYAAFADKYGQTPDDIKARIRDEVKQELLAAKRSVPGTESDKVPDNGMAAPRFSEVTGDPVRGRRRSHSLQDVFGR